MQPIKLFDVVELTLSQIIYSQVLAVAWIKDFDNFNLNENLNKYNILHFWSNGHGPTNLKVSAESLAIIKSGVLVCVLLQGTVSVS